MLFTKRFWPGIADGSITLTYRRWRRQQVLAGRRYRTPAGILEVTSVSTMDPDTVSDHEARRAGFRTQPAWWPTCPTDRVPTCTGSSSG